MMKRQFSAKLVNPNNSDQGELNTINYLYQTTCQSTRSIRSNGSKFESIYNESYLFKALNIKKAKISKFLNLTEDQEKSLKIQDCLNQTQLLQQLIYENVQLKKQNYEKERLINQLKLTKKRTNFITKCNDSKESKSQDKINMNQSKQLHKIELKKEFDYKLNDSPYGFTFQNSERNYKRVRLPKEFQIAPNKKRYII